MPAPQGTGTYPSYIGNSRLLSTAGGGTALSTTTAFIAIPAGIHAVTITPRNFATAVVAEVSLNPFITVVKTLDSMSTAPADYSENAQDGVAGTLITLSSLPTLANGGAVYVGAEDFFAGLQATVVNGSGGAGAMAVTYWDGNSWENITPTDNTTNLNASGSITWTVPTDWAKVNLGQALTSRIFPPIGTEQYWVRIATSVVYDATTTLSSLYALNRYSTQMEIASGQVYQTAINRPLNGGVIQAATDAGTANLIVNGFY
jgi:hypothetical protein